MFRMTKEECEAKLDEIEQSFNRHDFTCEMLLESTDRRGLARVAASIAEDRYGAGSAASRATLYVLLKFGMQAAQDFASDLAHHED